jgi:superfamily II DNA/RNA helicase
MKSYENYITDIMSSLPGEETRSYSLHGEYERVIEATFPLYGRPRQTRLCYVLNSQDFCGCIIFVDSASTAISLSKTLADESLRVICVHEGKHERSRLYEKFRAKSSSLMISTLDDDAEFLNHPSNVDLIINYTPSDRAEKRKKFFSPREKYRRMFTLTE